MHVPFVDLYALHKPLEKKFTDGFLQVLRSSSFVAGKATEAFEAEFAALCGAKHALLVNNGTSALLAACIALDLPQGSEVILPANTFIATAEAPMLCGLKPVLVDVDPVTMLMDLEQAVKKVTKKTSAIIPVHLYGQRVDVAKLKRMLKAKKLQVAIIEDACQAHGSLVAGKAKVEGDLACYSFYPGKNLGALGEAGAIVTNSKSLDASMRLYRGHGSKIKYHHDIVGMNLRASEMEAVFLRSKLPFLAQQNAVRVQAASWYAEALQGVLGISMQEPVMDGSHVYHLFVVQATHRERLIEYLHDHGIDTGIHYPIPLHKTKALMALGYGKKKFPVTEQVAKTILSLPMFGTITKVQVLYVANTIKEFYKIQD